MFRRAAVLAAWTASFASAAILSVAPEVSVTGGNVRGALAGPGAVFKGIPFAAPPVGAWRWREPQPVQSWRGVRDATQYSAACVQTPLGTGAFLAPLARRYGRTYPTPNWNLSEDCLYLNIWTPAWPPREPHAVMFWIHGGSNRIGSGNEAGYDGSELARHGVIVVTVNYRLGALGFFAHPDLTRESPHHASGNYGLLDQIAALLWVRSNIASFGGDPARVTVFGESAGAIDAGMLMCSPLARGLFARAIMESGPVLGVGYTHSQQQAGHFGQRISTLALRGRSGPQGIEQLRAIPAPEILRAAADAAREEPDPGFVRDGWVLPESPQSTFAHSRQARIALLIGNNGREASVFRNAARGPATPDAGLRKTLNLSYGKMANVAIAAFMVDMKLNRSAAADEWLNDALMTCPSAAMSTLQAGIGQPAYLYQFRRAVPGPGLSELGSFHSLELPYVFGAQHSPVWDWLPFQKADADLAAGMQLYWTNFAKTGNPNGGSLPRWEPFTGRTEDYMEFSQDGRLFPKKGVRPTFCSLDPDKLRQRLLDNQ